MLLRRSVEPVLRNLEQLEMKTDEHRKRIPEMKNTFNRLYSETDRIAEHPLANCVARPLGVCYSLTFAYKQFTYMIFQLPVALYFYSCQSVDRH